MTDLQLQRMFKGKTLNIEGIERECYYCTLEDGGAWIWLHTKIEDKCRQINFVVRSKRDLEDLYKQVKNKEVITASMYGSLSFQQ